MEVITRQDAEVVSATGGSARSQVDALDERRWKPHRGVSLGIRAATVLIPFACAVVAVQVAARVVLRPTTPLPFIAWLLGLATIATATLWLVDRQARRLLPLAAMLRLSLVFPDHAPSRFAVALKSGSAKALERSLARVETETHFATSQECAEHVIALVAAISKHDRLTRGHCERVRAYSDLIGEQLGLDPDSASKLHWAALLHDVGKLDVPAEILSKKGRLTAEEWEIVRGHPAASDRWLTPLRSWLGEWALAATEHHERFDGDGYPNGLRGQEISLAGRIVGVADAFDVMTAARSYKKPYPAAQARAELADNAGTQFDPAVVRAFLAISLGRLRLVMGPLAWLTGLPGYLSLGGVASSAGTAAAAAVVAASGLVAPAPSKPHASNSGGTRSSAPQLRGTTGARPTSATTGSTRHGTTARDASRSSGRSGTNAPVSGGATSGAGSTTGTGSGSGGGGSSTGSGASGGGSTSGGSSGLPSLVGPSLTVPVTTPVTVPSTVVPTPTTTGNHGGGGSSGPPTTAGDDAPVANPDSPPPALLGGRIVVDVLANDTDPDGDLDPSTLKIVSYPPSSQYQSISVNGSKIDIRPNPLFTGTMNITYQVCDDAGHCATATVTATFILSLI
jgi:HD domain-containing protein/Big-like domain-containing protein